MHGSQFLTSKVENLNANSKKGHHGVYLLAKEGLSRFSLFYLLDETREFFMRILDESELFLEWEFNWKMLEENVVAERSKNLWKGN
jgi:hypothetical protein